MLKVASMVIVAEKMGIRVGWIDKVPREMGAKRDHFPLLQEARLSRSNSGAPGANKQGGTKTFRTKHRNVV